MGNIKAEGINNIDEWLIYQRLVTMSFVKYFEIHQGSNEFASDMQHINDIEYSWRHVKHRLLQVNDSPIKISI